MVFWRCLKLGQSKVRASVLDSSKLQAGWHFRIFDVVTRKRNPLRLDWTQRFKSLFFFELGVLSDGLGRGLSRSKKSISSVFYCVFTR